MAVARRRERLEELQQVIISRGVSASEFLPVVCDTTKEPEVVALPKIVAKRWPDAGIDILINNAGLSRNNARLFDGDTTSWVEMLSTNVLGVCMCTREVIQVCCWEGPLTSTSKMMRFPLIFLATLGRGVQHKTKIGSKWSSANSICPSLQIKVSSNPLPMQSPLWLSSHLVSEAIF